MGGFMNLSLGEIRRNAMAFANAWSDTTSERAEAQTFWTEFFAVFGIKRRSVASFEEKVRNLKGAYDRIDVFYSGVMIGEHKSLGADLSKAASQAFNYVQSLTREGRSDEAPQYIVVSDFAWIVLYDLESKTPARPLACFPTLELHENIGSFGFLSGYSSKPLDPEDPINIRAVEILGDLHDALEQGGYSGHQLERFLVRILFCLFADDTGIFEPDTFKILIKSTRTDAADLGPMLARFSDVLDTDKPQRPKNLPDELRDLPFVNGALFHEDLKFADFTASMRTALLKCCDFNWSRISPAVFGSLFQSIMAGESGKKKRRQIGAHYTSERDILKLVRSLFLDDLQAELAKCGMDRKKLHAFHEKLASLRFLDPACGCGNFLVVTYRELRLLELEILKRLRNPDMDQQRLVLDSLLKVDVDQLFGIEIEEWPARIAEVAMWLVDHQMNQKVGEVFGAPVLRLPLEKSAKIVVGNALRIDWNEVLPASECSYVMGNPPFVGAKFQNEVQKADISQASHGIKSAGLLDYVCGWYLLASRYISGTLVRAAFVSTNSITQGEQVGVLWAELFERGIKIHFAHRTFGWMSEARGKAHVHVVIISFGAFDREGKVLYDYPTLDGEPHPTVVSNISPYLAAGPDIIVTNRSTALCSSPEMGIGNKPVDGGNYLFTSEEMKEFLRVEPRAKRLFRPWYGSREFIHGEHRWCLWLGETPPAELKSMPSVMFRIENVRRFREASGSAPTRKIANSPKHFHVENRPQRRYLVIPKVSSEKRDYIPIGFLKPSVLSSDLLFIIPNSDLYHFGVLTSAMHMAWVRQVCGRLKSDFRYSNKLVYNNFPWPQDLSEKQKAAVEIAAQGVLDARAKYPRETLAALYDPLCTPKPLVDAHRALNRAVDKCYRAARFDSEWARVEFLFNLYQRLTAPLTVPEKGVRRKK
jgi:type I restriction-modification system DNA methylase subunit